MGLDDSTDRDSIRTKPDAPTAPLPEFAPNPNGGEPTVTLSQRDRLQAETGLLFGLLALANGLIPQESLTRAFGAWALEPGRSFREVLVGRGHLDESAASLVDTLAERHLEQHHGIAWESLIALGQVVQFRFDPKEVADSELRVILGGFVAKGDGPRPPAQVAGNDAGFGSRYEIVKHHASGGLGVVSLARDAEMRREVALKEIRPDCADNLDYRARFVREAEVTGRLEHPGIVPVYGIGHRDDGRPYYIMRFIRGETLKAAIARLHKPRGEGEDAGPADRPDLHALVGRFIDACHAVAYAHHRKVLHRDIKPINIMLGPYGETLVVDWGLAKSFEGPRSDEFPTEDGTLRPESGSELTPTRMGSQVGTTGYMSPEQAAGRLLELGPTSDIYSLGVTLHYLATGHAPFEGAGKEEFLRRVREGDFPRPSKVNPSVPRPLEAICMKAMALRPIDRYPSAEALAEDLERWRAGQPVLAYPEPPIDRLARWAKGQRTALVGAAVLLVCATVGMAVFAGQKSRENTMVKAERALSQANLMLTRRSLGLMVERLDGPDLAYLPESGPVRLRLAGEFLNLIRDLLKINPADPDVRLELARASRISANIGRSMGEFGQPRQRYSAAIALLDPLTLAEPGSDRYRIELAWTYQDLGEHLRMAGQPRSAEAEQLKALDTLIPVGAIPVGDDRFPRMEATALIDLAVARLETGRPLEALPQARRAVESLTRLAEKPRADVGDRLRLLYALNAKASSLMESGDREAARKELDEAERAARELNRGHQNTDTRFALAIILDAKGLFLAEAGEPAEAEKRYDEANAILHDLHGKNQRFVFLEKELAISSNGRGAARFALYRLKPDPELINSAESDCERARESFERIARVWPNNFSYQSHLGRSLANLGRIALARNRKDQARDRLRQSLARHQSALEFNSESPDDAKLARIIRDELEQIEPGRIGAGSSP